MDIISLDSAPDYDPTQLVAVPFLEGEQSNVRVIRLSPGQRVPNHSHGPTEVMLYVVEGSPTFDTDEGPRTVGAGSLARIEVGEELRLGNDSDSGVTLLAFLTPPFPPR